MSALPIFEVLNTMLRRNAIGMDAAELQGSMCAQIAVVEGLTRDLCLTLLLGDRLVEIDPDTDSAMAALFEWTDRSLRDIELGFALYLPDDSESLDARAEALALWCAGFLAGLGLVGVDDVDALPVDAREYVADLAEIAKADFPCAQSDEETEGAFCELVEYTRMGAVLMFEALRESPEQQIH